MWYSAAKRRCVHDAVLYLHFLCCYWTKPWKMLSIYKLPRERDNVRGNWSSSSPEETLTLLSTYISNTQWMSVSFSVLKLAFTKYLAFVGWNLCHYLKVSSHTYLCLYNSIGCFCLFYKSTCCSMENWSGSFKTVQWRCSVHWHAFPCNCLSLRAVKGLHDKKGRMWSLSSLPQGSSILQSPEHRKKIRNLLIWQVEW